MVANEDNVGLRSIFICRNAGDLNRLDSAVHLTKFEVENFYYDSDSRVAELNFEDALPREARTKRIWPFIYEISVPIRQWLLRFYDVKSVKIDDSSRIGTYEFSSMAWNEDAKIVQIDAAPTLFIEIHTPEPVVEVFVSAEASGILRYRQLSLTRVPDIRNRDTLM